MTFGEMRAVFRTLANLSGRYSVTDAVEDAHHHWSVGVVVRRRCAYRLTDFDEFETKFPHLMPVYEEPRYYGPDEARLTWIQVLFALGCIEEQYPRVQAHGVLQSPEGFFELALSKAQAPDSAPRSGIYLLDTPDDVARVLAA